MEKKQKKLFTKKDGRKWICSNSAKILTRNYWYHTQCVSGRLDHKTDFFKNCWKKINYFPREGGGGGYPSMENSITFNVFFIETFPKGKAKKKCKTKVFRPFHKHLHPKKGPFLAFYLCHMQNEIFVSSS